MRRILLFVLFLLPAFAGADVYSSGHYSNAGYSNGGYSNEDHYNLARVIVTGSSRFHEDDLVRSTGLTVNTQVTSDDLQAAANRLGNSGAFSTVQFLFKPAIGAKGVEADFEVADSDKFLPAVFENFIWFSDSELQQAIHQTVPLYNGQIPASGTLCDDVSAALIQFLTAKHLPSEVSYMLAGNFGQASSSYKFRVDNATLKIRDVTVTGATHILPDQLAKSLAPLKGIDYLRSDVAIILEKNLVPIYHQHGYLKFAVSEIKPKQEDKELISIDVSVSEGDQYQLAGFGWSGNTLIPSDELSKRITVKTGEPIDALQLERDLIEVRKLFGKYGREGLVITPMPVFNANTVTFTFAITEGELYHMGKLEIQGVDTDAAHKLAQNWKLAEGEPYDSTYVQQFLSHTLLKIPGHKWSWMNFEQIDDSKKTVNVRLQVKID